MSVKKVFAIIGIVVGCVAAFVGGVFGVMAAMGKFKTPVVKPEKLYFETPEQVIVAEYYDKDKNDVLYSFTLVGENDSVDHPVNVKDCYIWFEDDIGEDLIELCDKDGKPLQYDSQKRYTIQCNEKVYYKIKAQYYVYEYVDAEKWNSDRAGLYVLDDGKYVVNKSENYDENVIYYTRRTFEENNPTLDLTSETNGKVVLRARTVDNTSAQTNQDLVIWVDRKVTSIFLDYGEEINPTNQKEQQQTINIGKDYELEFGYIVNPELAWQPISKESKKIVELYYDDEKTEDFVLVTPENIKNKTAYSLYKIFDETKSYTDETTGEMKLTFRAGETTSNGAPHVFKLAIFSSYNARAEFLERDRLTLLETGMSIQNSERLEYMVVTNLKVNVINSNIDEVTMSDESLNLGLYSNNTMYLNNGSADNNLGVEMSIGGDPTDIRMHEVDFKNFDVNFDGLSPKFEIFISQTGVISEFDFKDYEILYNGDYLRLTNKFDSSVLEFTVNKTIKIGDYDVINSLENADGTYHCINGVALLKDADDSYQHIIPNSYLNFYVYNVATGSYELAKEADIKYTIEKDESYVKHADAKWNITVESVNEAVKDNLVLGLLVANNDARFDVTKLFAKKVVNVSVDALIVNTVNGSATLDLIAEHNVDDNTIKYSHVDSSEKDFDYFIQVAKGTYDACVFVISEDDLSKSIVEYTNIYYQNPYDSKKYYIVGYFNESNLFVNNIRTINNEEATKDSEIVLTMLQLKNNYKETAEAMINNRLLAAPGNPAEPIQLDSVFVEALKGETVTIRQNLLLDESIKFITTVDEATNPVDNPDKLYSETPNHTLTVKSETKGIVDKIVNFYGINIDSINNQPIVNNVSYYIINDKLTNVEIKNVNNASNVLILTFDIFGTVYSGENVNIGLANMFADGDIESLYSFKIESSAPEKIVFYYDTDKKIELVEEGYTPPQVKAKITWNGSNYVTTWYYGTDELGTTFELNKQFSIATSGFQDGEGFKVGHPIEYNITGNSVVIDKASEPNILNVVGAGQATLAVLVSGVTRYLDIVVDTSSFDIVKTDNSNILEDTIVGAIDGATGWLRNYIDYTYEGTGIYYDATALSDVKLSDFTPTYGGGNLTVAETAESITFTNSKPVLKIERVSTASGYDWKFTRTSDFNARLSITFKVETLTTSKTCRIDFEADVMHDLNSAAWGTDPVLYQGTTIKLYEKSNYGAGGYNFNNQPLIQIMDKAGGNTVKFYEKDKGPDTASPEQLDDNKKLEIIGKFEFDIWVEKSSKEGTEKILIAQYSFDVVPNIVAKQTTTGAFKLSSGKDVTDEFFNKVKLYQYKTKLDALRGGTDIVYGATKDELGRVVVYSTENAVVDNTNPASPTTESVLEDKTNYLKSQVGVTSIEEKSEGKPWVKTESNVITSEWIENVGGMQEVNLVVSTTSGNIIGTFEAVVKNSYKVTTNFDNIKDKTLNIMAMKDIAAMFEVTGFSLKSIKWTYSDDNSNGSKGPYEVGGGILKIPANAIPANAGSYDNVSLILIFTGGSKELIFAGTNINDIQDLKINIIPFELTTLANIKAYSGEEFNLLTGVYDTTDITNYTSIEVMSVTDKDGNSLTGNQLGVAYNSTHNSGLAITFNDIVGDRVQAFIKYRVIYNDGTPREYSKEITLWNWQDVISTYPEQHDSLKTAEDLTLNGGSLAAGERFEAVLIDNDDSFVLNLLNDDIKHIKRITAKDRTTESSSDVEIEDLYVLANTDSLDINRYVEGNNITIEKQTGKITFGSYGLSFEGFVVFEMVLSSGNIEKYVVWLTSKGSEINYCSASKTATKCDTGSATATGAEINLESLVDDDYLENTFKVEDGSKVKMFLLKATTLNPKDIDDEVDFNLGSQYSCVDGKTAKINDYTTITLSLVYDAEDTYPVGILTLVLRPSGAITTIAGFGHENAGITDGKFAKVLDANDTYEEYPTDDFAVTSIVQENSSVVTNDISEKKLIISQRVDKDYTFTVFYKHSNGYTIKVTYTLPKVNIKQGTEITVGDFNGDTFNTTLEINKNNYLQLFGNYKGNITFEGTTFNISGDYVFAPVSPAGTTGTITTGINYEIVDGVLKLTFTQYLYDVTKTIDVSYNNLYTSSSNKRVYTFTVKSGVYIEEAGVGTEEFNRKETTRIADSYTSDRGSKLDVVKSGISVAKYEVAGYTIYINNASGKLELAFAESDSPYVLNDGDTTFKLLSSGGTINFAHIAAPRDINVEIRIVRTGTDDYFKVDEATVLVKNLYLTIAKTYEDVEAVYIAKSETIDEQTYKVEAENVVKGRLINNLREYFFTEGNDGKIYTIYIYTDVANWLANKENLFVYNSDTKSYVKTTDAAYDSSKTYYLEFNNFDGAVANQIKLKLIDVNGNSIITDFSAMGFTTNGNPNYIRFESTSGLAPITDNKITFSSEISENTLCNINLSNDAGMSCTYSFQIMKDVVEDGISYANAGFAGDKSGDEKIDYMSFVIEDKIAEVDFTTGKLKIGTISDGRAKGVYVYVDITNDSTNNPEWKFLPRNSVMENIIHGTHFYNLTLESSGDLYIEYHRGAGACLDEITEIVLNVHGTTTYIVKDFNIVLFNMTISPVKETVTIIYSGDSKEFGELINMPTTVGSSITSVDVELNTKNSGFKLHGQGGDYTSLTANDDILQANNAAEIITTNIVGEDLDMKLIFTIKINGYFINDVECLILLKRSVQFVFNGDTAEKDEDGGIKILDRYAFETNFVLTNVNGANVSKFSDENGIEIGFGALLDNDARKLVDGIYYYSQLIWKLEKRKTTELAVDFAIDSTEHTNGLIDGVTLDNVNKKLIFKKDYTGDINLVLTVTLTSGFDYVVNWKIKVFGILDAQQQNKTEYDYLLNSGNLFNSGEDVTLLNSLTDARTGIFLKDMTGVFNNTIKYWDSEDDGKKVIDNITYQYAIVENSNNNDKTNEQRFEAADEANKSEVFGDKLKADGVTTDNTDDIKALDRVFSVALPIVPHGKEYRVIYKVVISYLGDEQEYFVTYLVKNNVGISVAEPEDGAHQKFDADNINVNQRLVDTTKLVLFYYSEMLKNGTSKFKYTLEGAYIKGSKEEGEVNIPASTILYDEWLTHKSNELGGYEKASEEYEWVNKVDGNITNSSVFRLNCGSIYDFGKFIESVGKVIIKTSAAEFKFNLVHIDGGRWGIDLTDRTVFPAEADNTVLFNNKLEDAQLIIQATNGQTIYSIDKYNESADTGFRMYTSNQLVAAGSQKFGDLFNPESIITGNWNDYKDIDIAGVYTGTFGDSNKWIKYQNNNDRTGIAVKENPQPVSGITIEVATGTATDIEYTLQTIVYKGSGGLTGICAVEDTFYIVYGATKDAIYRFALAKESAVKYTQGQDTRVSLNDFLYKFKNAESGKLVNYTSTTVSSLTRDSGAEINHTLDGNVITIAETNLIGYKNQHPNKKYATVVYDAEFDSIRLQISINYSLPELPSKHINKSGLETSTEININSDIYVLNAAGNYVELSGELNNVTNIKENASNYTSEFKKDTTGKYTGVINLNKDAVDEYFTTTGKNILNIKYTITTNLGDLTFEIVVKNS